MKIVSIGGYGHSVCAFDEIIQMHEAKLVAYAPAFDGEDLSIITSHKIYNDNILYYDNYKEMLDNEKPDVVIISTRLDKIAEVSIDAANKGCHLICEKPLALSQNDLTNLYEAVKKNNVKLMAMLSMRAEQPFIAAREIYQSGKIGEAVLINSRKSYKWAVRPEWFGDKSKYGSTIGWVGIHALDFINFITGLEFVSVAAMKSNFSHPERKDCDDNVGMVLELSNGGHATASVDFFRPKTAETHGDDWIRIVGTKGVLEASTANNNCVVITDEEKETIIPENLENKIFKNFLNSLIRKTNPDFSEYIPFMLTNACLSAVDSAVYKKDIKIDNSKWK